MRLYVALLQKEKNSEKPTIQSINDRMKDYRSILPEVDNQNASQEDLNIINIDTHSDDQNEHTAHQNQDLDYEEIHKPNTLKTRTLISTTYMPPEPSDSTDNLPLLIFKDPLRTSSETLHQTLFPEVSLLNKSILEKNSEHVPKQRIISSIRKFDDRCRCNLIYFIGINYRKAHRSLVDLTVGYLHKCKVQKHTIGDAHTRLVFF